MLDGCILPLSVGRVVNEGKAEGDGGEDGLRPLSSLYRSEMSLKLANICRPCVVPTDSGWNCTPKVYIHIRVINDV